MKLLADPDAWWRETAQRLLFERQDRSVVGALQAMVATRPSALGRLHALWTLELLSSLDAGSIELGLADPEPRVREAAIRLAEARLEREPALLDKTLALAGDPDPMVRFQLAFSLGEVKNDPRAMAALASIAGKDAANPMDSDGGAELDRRPRRSHSSMPSQSKTASSRPRAGPSLDRRAGVPGWLRAEAATMSKAFLDRLRPPESVRAG